MNLSNECPVNPRADGPLLVSRWGTLTGLARRQAPRCRQLSMRRKPPTAALSSPRCAAHARTLQEDSIARAARPKTASASSSNCGQIALLDHYGSQPAALWSAAIAYILCNAMRRIVLRDTQFAERRGRSPTNSRVHRRPCAMTLHFDTRFTRTTDRFCLRSGILITQTTRIARDCPTEAMRRPGPALS